MPTRPNDDLRSASITRRDVLRIGGCGLGGLTLANLLRVAKQQLEIRIDRQRRIIHPTDPSLPDFPIAFVHGRRTFRWSAKEREALKSFVENGGVIFADAICASRDFADAFRKEMAAILPEHQLKRIPPNHPINLIVEARHL